MSTSNTAFCFDLDGTLTRHEVLPILAKEVGLADEIGALTSATMQGVLPFQQSFSLRVRLLSDVSIKRAREIVAAVPLYEMTAAFAKKHHKQCFVITGNLDVWVSGLADRIGCTVLTAQAKSEGDRLSGISVFMDKGEAVKKIKEKFDRVVAIGDGMNDVPMFEQGDIKIAFGGTHSPADTLIKMADYVTFHERGLCHLLDTLL